MAETRFNQPTESTPAIVLMALNNIVNMGFSYVIEELNEPYFDHLIAEIRITIYDKGNTFGGGTLKPYSIIRSMHQYDSNEISSHYVVTKLWDKITVELITGGIYSILKNQIKQ